MSSATCSAALLIQSVPLLNATLEEEAGMGCVCLRGITDVNYRGGKNKHPGQPGTEDKMPFETKAQ